MIAQRVRLAFLIFVVVLGAISCGTSGGGSPHPRPAEALFFVRGVSGTPFQVAALEAENAAHVDLINGVTNTTEFQVPYTFVMLNADPVVSGIFRNTDPNLPITVTLVLGFDIANVQEIPPGACCIVTPGAVCVPDPLPCDHPPPPFGLEVRFNVVSFTSIPPPPPPQVPFTAAIGDLVNGTDATNCVFSGSTSNCQTPVVFFLEGAQDQVAGVFNKADNSDFGIHAELLVDGALKSTEVGRTNVIVQTNL